MGAARRLKSFLYRIWHYTYTSLNFYRIHILFFCITPLIFSAIFYASNGDAQIAYVDSLFCCVSAMTVTGLATIDLSQLTGWQQAILFIQMCLGSPVAVAWVTVLIRKYFFKTKFQHLIRDAKARHANGGHSLWRVSTFFRRHGSLLDPQANSNGQPSSKRFSRVRPDMIRRVDDVPKLVNPMGWVDQKERSPTVVGSENDDANEFANKPADHTQEASEEKGLHEVPQTQPSTRRYSRRLSVTRTFSVDRSDNNRLSHVPSRNPSQANGTADGHTGQNFYRSQTIEFVPQQVTQRHIHERDNASHDERHRSMATPSINRMQRKRTGSFSNPAWTGARAPRASTEVDFGGFPMPHVIISRLIKKAFPDLGQRLTRTVTIPQAATYGPEAAQGAKPAPYISFDAVVGRNSNFAKLTSEQEEELGGVEYRGIKMLLWIVGAYHVGIQLFLFVLCAGYFSASRWHAIFTTEYQHKFVPPVWFSAFQAISTYTNTGMSLVDQSMVPFQKAYPVIIFMALSVLAGNTAFPVFLRLLIWIISKCVPETSRTHETLRFLLDHPRRCFLYLFPSHQTWFLFTVVLLMSVTDWLSFLILDIGTPEIMALSPGTRVVLGILQATAVRAAGFASINLSLLAPSVKVLYVIMMYVSVYPIALSVRSTNVYEERSLGVYATSEFSEAEPEDLSGSRVKVWGTYLAFHARKQLSFDMWWLALALWIICILERKNLTDPNKLSWFNIFSIIFELVSAYGTVGLSLGTPVANYSFSGTFRPLSKVVVCAVMLRGRHRGLPHAIDRAVLLPFEYTGEEEIAHRTTQHTHHTHHSAHRSRPTSPDQRDAPLAPHPLDPLPPVAEARTPHPRPSDEKEYIDEKEMQSSQESNLKE